MKGDLSMNYFLFSLVLLLNACSVQRVRLTTPSENILFVTYSNGFAITCSKSDLLQTIHDRRMPDFDREQRNLEQFTRDTICQIVAPLRIDNDSADLKVFYALPVFPDLLLNTIMEGGGKVFNTKKNKFESDIKIKKDKYGCLLYTQEGELISFISSGLLIE